MTSFRLLLERTAEYREILSGIIEVLNIALMNNMYRSTYSDEEESYIFAFQIPMNQIGIFKERPANTSKFGRYTEDTRMMSLIVYLSVLEPGSKIQASFRPSNAITLYIDGNHSIFTDPGNMITAARTMYEVMNGDSKNSFVHELSHFVNSHYHFFKQRGAAIPGIDSTRVAGQNKDSVWFGEFDNLAKQNVAKIVKRWAHFNFKKVRYRGHDPKSVPTRARRRMSSEPNSQDQLSIRDYFNSDSEFFAFFHSYMYGVFEREEADQQRILEMFANKALSEIGKRGGPLDEGDFRKIYITELATNNYVRSFIIRNVDNFAVASGVPPHRKNEIISPRLRMKLIKEFYRYIMEDVYSSFLRAMQDLGHVN